MAAVVLWLLAATAVAGPVTLNLKNADINALVASISEITGRNFIVDPRVKARVTVISSRPMEEEEVYEVFQAILAVHGFAAIPGDNVTKIVPEANAKQDAIPTVDRQGASEGDQIVTQVIQVQNVSAAQIVPILRPLIPPQGHLAAYAPTNVLIVSDRAANVQRIANIISRVDLASNEEVEIVPLQHASATDVVRLLTALEQGRTRNDPGAAAPPRMVADERTNSVLMTGDTASRVRLRTLISHLDTPLETGGNTQVVYLRYAKATDLLPVLQGVSRTLGEDQPAAQQGQGPGSATIDIQADEATNSLVITAPQDAIRSLKSVIAQLDIRRAQVLVEAVIAEIKSDRAAQLGIQWLLDATRDEGGVAFTNFTEGTSLASAIAGAQAIRDGNIPGSAPAGLTLGVGTLGSRVRFGALVSALASDTDTNVMSTPTLVTLDNEEAEIIVGQNVPFVTGSFTTTTGETSTNPFQTIQREDVGLNLKIKPQINEGNAVRLEVTQEVSSVVPSANSSTQGPTTSKRSIKTTVLVEDGQILVLGGLIEDSLNESLQKVPGLGDVPLVGNLFRFRSTDKSKTNLMVFLHPLILRDSTQGTLSTNQKYSYIRAQQLAERERGVNLMPGTERPLLSPPEQVRDQRSLIDLRGASGPAPAPPARPLRRQSPQPSRQSAPAPAMGFNNK